ncbi:hypothetical protein M5C72_05945 [Companilactobacillus allii]|uniref:Uncharacterized protein n=1 Tax=Companilactobacillus allii TaxID=1847728 RepID=A0A1P8Q474_9LACO|nr:hypothetical protein [Companilactobacillus allii]APX72654.1 hypothetical protein BTM29_08860 [Companilactobacillus allii]USQ69757.1 hypothetical protein M5C72_05945 [Companilactobacillus allii]
MIGLVLNEQLSKDSIESLKLSVNKLRLLTSNIIIPTSNKDFQVISQIFNHQKNVKVIEHVTPFTNYGSLSDIYSASIQYNGIVEFLTISPINSHVNQEVLSIISDNQNSFATTIDQNCFTISHFLIDSNNLTSYLNLDNFDLEDFLTQEIQCMPVSFAKNDIF